MSYALQVMLRARTGEEGRFLALAQENANGARKEPGCRQFDILVDPADAAQMMLYEVYDDERAFEAHQQTPHFKAYLADAVPLLESRVRRVWRRE